MNTFIHLFICLLICYLPYLFKVGQCYRPYSFHSFFYSFLSFFFFFLGGVGWGVGVGGGGSAFIVVVLK